MGDFVTEACGDDRVAEGEAFGAVEVNKGDEERIPSRDDEADEVTGDEDSHRWHRAAARRVWNGQVCASTGGEVGDGRSAVDMPAYPAGSLPRPRQISRRFLPLLGVCGGRRNAR